MSEISVKHRYVNITVDVAKIHRAFASICDDAHGNGAGSARDALYLSFHQCRDTQELQQAQSLLKVVEMAEHEGAIQSDEEFSLQAEYEKFFEKWEDEQRHEPDKRNKPSPYGPGDWRHGK